MAKKRLFQFTEELMTASDLEGLLEPEWDKGTCISEVQILRKFTVKFDKEGKLVIPEAK